MRWKAVSAQTASWVSSARARDAQTAAGRGKEGRSARTRAQGLRARATILPLALHAATPVISPDGKTLVFRARERGRANLYSYNLDELADEPAVAQQLTQSDRPKGDFALA
eukprot:gene29654-33379_t